MKLDFNLFFFLNFLVIIKAVFIEKETDEEKPHKNEFLIRLKIPETVSNLFTTIENNIKEEIALKNLIRNSFWRENIFNEILSQQNKINFLNTNPGAAIQSTDDQFLEMQLSLAAYNSTMEALFEKLVELQHAIKQMNIIKHIHFNGFEAIKATLSTELLAELKLNPFIADIDFNEQFHAFSVVPDKNPQDGKLDPTEENISVQYNAPRHLARMSRRSKLIEQSSTGLNYYYQNNFIGTNISVYILDTGISANHPQLEGRVVQGASFVNERPGDFNGHGTHVAGIVGSKDYGVCKNCTLVEVKCLNQKGQGDLTTVISAIEFAVEDMLKTGKKAVANLSLGSFRSRILNEAVRAATVNGLVMVVAAGNNNMNACLNSPASEFSAITVGAIDDRSDMIASFSNWGECVDIFASGVKVESLSFENFQNSIKFSGTSMATPSVSGLAAILLDMGVDTEHIKDKLIEISSKDFIRRRTLLVKPRTPNRLLFNGVVTDIEEYDKYLDTEIPCDTGHKLGDKYVFNEDLNVSDVPIKEKLSQRNVWLEPSFQDLQATTKSN